MGVQSRNDSDSADRSLETAERIGPTVALLSLAALALGAMLDWYGIAAADQWMPATRDLVFNRGEFWRLFTTLFVHGDLGHLVANGLLYFILGYYLYGHFGFVLFPFTAWMLAVPMTALALASYGPHTYLIGASGLVHLMGGLWLSLFYFIARNLSAWQRILRAGGVMLGIFFPTSFEATTSYRTHFIGLGLGLLYGTIYYRMNLRTIVASEIVINEPDDEPEEPGDSPNERLALSPPDLPAVTPPAVLTLVKKYDFDSDDDVPPRGTRDN